MRLIIIALTVVMTTLAGLPPTKAEPLSETDRYDLCSKSPYNAQCKGYQAPIAFADRPGEAGACVITINRVETQTICKLTINNDKITAYQEIGEALPALKGKKASQEILLSPSAIKAIRYREDKKSNATARAINTALFGLGGLFTRDKKVAEMAIDYLTPPPPASAAGALTAKAAPADPPVGTLAPPPETGMTTLTVVVRRKTGEGLRSQLEQLTGLKAAVPPVEKPPQPERQPSELDANP